MLAKAGLIDGVEHRENVMLESMETDFVTIKSPKEPSRGEEDWYVFASNIVPEMIEEGYGKEDLFEKLVVAHIVEMLSYDSVLYLINMVNTNYDSMLGIAPSITPLVKNYFDQHLIKDKGITGMLTYKGGVVELLIKNAQGMFAPAEAEDYTDMAPAMKSLQLTVPQLSNIVGFVTGFKKEYMVFKTKQMDKKRHKGARCDQSGKSESLRVLNMIIEGTDTPEYTLENTRNISQRGICVRQELTLRAFSAQRRDERIWFLSPALGALINIEKLSSTD